MTEAARMNGNEDAARLAETLYSLWDVLKAYSRREGHGTRSVFHHWVSGIAFQRQGEEEAVSFDLKEKRYTLRCVGFWASTGDGPRLPDDRIARIRLTLLDFNDRALVTFTRPGDWGVETFQPGEWVQDVLMLAESLNAIAQERWARTMLKRSSWLLAAWETSDRRPRTTA